MLLASSLSLSTCTRLWYILRVSRTQHIRTEEIRNRLRIDHTIGREVSRARLRMLFKVARSEKADTNFSAVYLRKLVEANEKVRHLKRGRPMKSWLHCVKADLAVHQYGLVSGMHLAKTNQVRFRQLYLD